MEDTSERVVWENSLELWPEGGKRASQKKTGEEPSREGKPQGFGEQSWYKWNRNAKLIYSYNGTRAEEIYWNDMNQHG